MFTYEPDTSDDSAHGRVIRPARQDLSHTYHLQFRRQLIVIRHYLPPSVLRCQQLNCPYRGSVGRNGVVCHSIGFFATLEWVSKPVRTRVVRSNRFEGLHVDRSLTWTFEASNPIYRHLGFFVSSTQAG